MTRLFQVLLSALTLVSGMSVASIIIPSPPDITAKAYVLMDYNTGEVLVSHNAEERLPPASLAKLMTSYVAEQELQRGVISEQETTVVSVKAWRTGGSRMFIQEGTEVSMIDLLRGIIIQSGNDAAVAMAEHLAGSEEAFADVMNQTAAQLGLINTQFKTATGLPAEGQYSSALDMANLAAAIIRDNPEYYPIYAEREFEYAGIKQNNRNRLLWQDPDVDGLKTGYTVNAGYNLVASAKNEDMRLIAVVFGTDSPALRAQETQTLLSYGFRYFKTHTIQAERDVLAEARVWGGTQESVALGVADSIVQTIYRGTEASFSTQITIDPVIKAPVLTGDQLGTLTVLKDGEELLVQPIVAKADVPAGGFFKRTWDAIKLFFWNIFN